MTRIRKTRAGEVLHSALTYPDSAYPVAGWCEFCNRRRPRKRETVSNFGCREAYEDDGSMSLVCNGCLGDCVPIFYRGEQPTATPRKRARKAKGGSKA